MKNDWKNISKENPYKAPDGYFNDLENRVLERIAVQAPPRKILHMNFVRWASSVAAVFLIGFIGVHQFYLRPIIVEAEQEAFVDVLTYYGDNLDTYSIATAMAEGEVFAMENTSDEAEMADFLDLDEYIILEEMLNNAQK